MSNYNASQAGHDGPELTPSQAVSSRIYLTHDQIEAYRRDAMRLRAETINSYVWATWVNLRNALLNSRSKVAGKVAAAADAAESGSPKSAGSR